MLAALRSVLFVPGVRPDRFASALSSGADAVVFDLEDSVEATRKAEARAADGRLLSEPFADGPPLRVVRVNAIGSPWIDDDLAAVARMPEAQAVVLPKTESARDVEAVARACAPRRVIPLLETARGILRADEIASAQAPIPALLFGAEDLTAQIGVARTVSGEELTFARSQVILAATAAGADAIDAVFIHLARPDDLRTDAERDRALGFRGKMAIHPGQVATINDIFSPTEGEVRRARELVDAYEAATARGEGVIRLNDQMIDTPIVTRARRVLELARMLRLDPA
jgi:citrate lyase subunit beta/citryl-CoA lyase